MLDARPLVVQAEVADGAVTVVVQGEVDIATAPELRQALARALVGRPNRVVVDLGPTTFIDWAGMKVIAQAGQAAPPNCEIILRSPSRLAQRVIEVTGMDRWFLIDRSAVPVTGSGPSPRRASDPTVVVSRGSRPAG